MPAKGTSKSAGYDLASNSRETIRLAPGQRVAVPSGWRIRLPPHHWGNVRSRSSVAFKHSVDACAGVIDEDYKQEVKVVLHNHGKGPYDIKYRDRIAQLLIQSICHCSPPQRAQVYPERAAVTAVTAASDGKDAKERIGGFGSTGI